MDTFWPRRADGRLAEKLPPEACIFRVNQLLDDRGLSQPELAHRSRFELLTAAKADPTAFWRSKLVSLPKTDGMYRILEDEEFRAGRLSTKFMERFAERRRLKAAALP